MAMKKGTCKRNRNKRGAKYICRLKNGKVRFSNRKIYK